MQFIEGRGAYVGGELRNLGAIDVECGGGRGPLWNMSGFGTVLI